MCFWKHQVRQVLLAALVVAPFPAWAGVAALFEAETGRIVLSGLTAETREKIMVDQGRVRLTVKQQISSRSMPFTLREESDALAIDPRFSLRPGTKYVLDIGTEQFEIAIPAPVASAPELTGFAPSQAVIPANTLRLYLGFSEPMARGQLFDMVRLVRSDGSRVESPFLNLETELWDPDQRRVTVVIDPGSLKQGVGPNIRSGAPLQVGQSYRLIISDRMKSAKGVSLNEQIKVTFKVGPPERRAINPSDWQVLVPEAETRTPFSVAFDRIMDSASAARLLKLEAPDGTKVNGEVLTDGGGWSVSPSSPWAPGRYRLIIDPELEDIAGNTPGAPFDAGAGTMGKDQKPTILSFKITR